MNFTSRSKEVSQRDEASNRGAEAYLEMYEVLQCVLTSLINDQLITLCSVHVYVHRDEASILLLISYRTYTVRKLVADNSNT